MESQTDHSEIQSRNDLFNSERESIEAQKKWIENSKYIANISTLEAQRHWINQTITEKDFAEKLLVGSNDSVKLNNFTLAGANSKVAVGCSSKEQKVTKKSSEQLLDLQNDHIKDTRCKKINHNKDIMPNEISFKEFTDALNKDEEIATIDKKNISASDLSPRSKIFKDTSNRITKRERKNSEGKGDSVKEDNDTMTKLHPAYDKDEMRRFIKQKQKERYERVLQENRQKENEKQEKLKKLEHLKQLQKKILENSKMRPAVKNPEKPQWIGPLEGTSVKTNYKNISRSPTKLSDAQIKAQSTGALIFKNSASNDLRDAAVTKPVSAGLEYLNRKSSQEKMKRSLSPVKTNLSLKSRPGTATSHSFVVPHEKQSYDIKDVGVKKSGGNITCNTSSIKFSANYNQNEGSEVAFQNLSESTLIGNIKDNTRQTSLLFDASPSKHRSINFDEEFHTLPKSSMVRNLTENNKSQRLALSNSLTNYDLNYIPEVDLTPPLKDNTCQTSSLSDTYMVHHLSNHPFVDVRMSSEPNLSKLVKNNDSKTSFSDALVNIGQDQKLYVDFDTCSKSNLFGNESLHEKSTLSATSSDVPEAHAKFLESSTTTMIDRFVGDDMCQTSPLSASSDGRQHDEININEASTSSHNPSSYTSCKNTNGPNPLRTPFTVLDDPGYLRVSRKRRSSKDDLQDENVANIKMKRFPKNTYYGKECLDCLESSLSEKKLTSLYRLSELTPEQAQILLEDIKKNNITSSQQIPSENLKDIEPTKEEIRLEIPTNALSSFQPEMVNSVECNNRGSNAYPTNVDVIEDNFRLALQSMVLTVPSGHPMANVQENKENSRNITSLQITFACDDVVIPDFSHVNIRRSLTSNTDRESQFSESLSVDPLRLSASVENLSLVPSVVNKTYTEQLELEKINQKPNMLSYNNEDEFISKCSSHNSNISNLIENLPQFNKDESKTSFSPPQELVRTKNNLSQHDSFEEKFVEKCSSHNTNVSSIDILQKSEDETKPLECICENNENVSEINLPDKKLNDPSELKTKNQSTTTVCLSNNDFPSDLQVYKNNAVNENIALRFKSSEHLAQPVKNLQSQQSNKEGEDAKKVNSSRSFVHLPKNYLEDINRSTCLGSSSSNNNLSDRQNNLPLVNTSTFGSSVKDLFPSENHRAKTKYHKVEKQRPFIDTNLSDHSSSYSEVVKVSRTVSRGSTVVSEVSEVHTLSTNSVKCNTSSLRNRIRNEIQHLDRLQENISSAIDTTNISSRAGREINSHQLLRKEDKLNCSFDVQSVNSSNSCSIDQHTNDTNSAELNEHKRGPKLVDISNISNLNVTTFSLEMLNDLLKDEDLKYEHHAAVIRMREKALIDRAKAEIAFLEMQKRELKEQGRDEEVRNLKKKQRGVVVRVDEEMQELQRIRKAEKNASSERKLIIQQQQQLLKLQMGNKYHPHKRSPSNKVQRGVNNRMSSNIIDSTLNTNYDRGSSLTPYLERKTRELREKENALMARKKNVESIVAWKQRLEQEEKRVREMEKLIALSPAELPHCHLAIDRGTSPMRFTIESKDPTVTNEVHGSIVQEQLPHHINATSHSESEAQNKEYNSDSFEQSSVLSDQLLANVTTRSHQNSILDSKRTKSMAALRIPLSPRVTILKRRHSSGSDESILFSQNETLSEQSDIEVRVTALQQQLKMRKAELEKLRKEYNKSQRERLRAKEQSLINQIQAYDTYIEQVKNELQKENEKSDVKVMKPQIKQPKFSERRKSEVHIPALQEKKKEDTVSESASNDNSLSPSHKPSYIEQVSEIIEHDSSETLDSVKTQLESKVFDSPENSISKEPEPTSQRKPSSLVLNDTINEAVPENIFEDELEIKSEKADVLDKITEDSVSEHLSKPENSEDQSISTEEPVETLISANVATRSSSGKPVSSENVLIYSNESKSQLQSISEMLSKEILEFSKSNTKQDVTSTVQGKTDSNIYEIIEENTNNSQQIISEHDVPDLLQSHGSITSDKGAFSFKDDMKSISEESEDQDASLDESQHNATDSTREILSQKDATEEILSKSAHVSEMVSDIKEQLETISKFLNEETSLADSILEEANKSQTLGGSISTHLSESKICDEESSVNGSGSRLKMESEKIEDEHSDNTLNSVHEISGSKNVSSKSITSIEELSLKEEENALDVSNLPQFSIVSGNYSGDVRNKSENISSTSEFTKDVLITNEDAEVGKILEDSNVPLSEGENLDVIEELIEELSDKSEHLSLFEIIANEKDSKIKEDLFNNDNTNVLAMKTESSGHNEEFKISSDSNETSEVHSVEDLVQELDISGTSSNLEADELNIFIDNGTSPSVSEKKSKIIDLLQDTFEISDKLWKENLEHFKNEETPLLTALQMERQKTMNIDYIWRDICDGCVSEATDAFVTAFIKKKNALAFYAGTYKENEGLTQADKVGDNEGFWLDERFTLQTAREAEQLRLQQLQIEQEIEELEQAQEAVPYYYVREIPNKPPPPYTPPGRVAPTPEETLARVSEAAAMLWEVEQSGGDVASHELPQNYLSSPNDQPHRLFLFELAKELYLKIRPSPVPNLSAWMIKQRPLRTLPKISTKEDLLRHIERQTKLVFGYEPRVVRENMIMKWSRKKRDHVDEILMKECQEEEQEWIDFTYEENLVKNQLADTIIDKVLEDAVNGLSLAFTKKFKDDSVS